MNKSFKVKEVPLLAIINLLKLKRFLYLLFSQETYPQTFSPEFLSICEYNS